MERIVEVTPDASAANTSRLRLQIKDLTEYARLPEEPSIPPGALFANTVLELRDHAQAERPCAGNLLLATDDLRLLPEVSGNKSEQLQMLGTLVRAFEAKISAQCSFQPLLSGWVSNKEVKTRGKSLHAVNEDSAMQMGRPRQDVPWRNAGARQQAVEDSVKSFRRDRSRVVESNCTATFPDDRDGTEPRTLARLQDRH